ncbi:MAG: hypothetical protein QOF48_511 [Verrucomicrobiota bacterium]|jgi:hypothetical protein
MVCLAGHAEDFVWRKDGKPIADTDSQKTRDGFGALLLLIDDKKFFDDWKKPDPPRLRTITNATRILPVHTTVIFAGAGRNADGEVHVTCDVTIRKPDGSVYGAQKGLVATRGRQTLSPTMLQLARDRLVVRIEPHDPAGTYTVEVTVKDNVKKVDLRLKERFTVSK